jgi:hypothetical protein
LMQQQQAIAQQGQPQMASSTTSLGR